jgi:hypothetical protein
MSFFSFPAGTRFVSFFVFLLSVSFFAVCCQGQQVQAEVPTSSALISAAGESGDREGGSRGMEEGLAVLRAMSNANRQFLTAIRLVRQADASFNAAEESRLLLQADQLFRQIIEAWPETDIAVKLFTNQFIGDFDYFEFKNRVKGLICNQSFLTQCFLHRISLLLPPIETPLSVARWDWLSLAVAYHLFGQPERGREIIGPMLAAVRRGAPPEGTERDLFVSRALSLIGEFDTALEITRGIDECSTRLYNLNDITEAALWHERGALAKELAEEAHQYALRQHCDWELGLVIQGLAMVGRHHDARAMFQQTVERQFLRYRQSRSGECCPPELAVAAAEMGDVHLALGLLRTVQEENSWTIPVVLGRLSRRGQAQIALSYAEQIQDPDIRGEAFGELIEALVFQQERSRAEDVFVLLSRLVEETAPPAPGLIGQMAKAEHVLHADERWRQSFQKAITAAERGVTLVRRDIGGPLIALLVRIETGRPMLD